MTHPDRTETRRSADHVAACAADLPDDAGNRALALLIASLLTPYGYGDPVLVAEWILGDRPPIDKHLDDLKGEFLADTDDLTENGRRLASERDDLIASGANPADLLVPKAPLAEIDDEEGIGGTDADQAAGWYTAAMGWKTRARGAEAALDRARKVADEMRPLKWAEILRDAIRGER